MLTNSKLDYLDTAPGYYADIAGDYESSTCCKCSKAICVPDRKIPSMCWDCERKESMSIKPCLFCKDNQTTVSTLSNWQADDSPDNMFVECLRCGAQGPIGCTKEEATNRWNSGHRRLEQSHE